ncbi:17411_t:CDS:2 [Cetraspora pellucida]|uniref:17411_t:CDS:1 n=1 Tax=Cetraspora pellucida TaxID=1433469 RepID=A0ACA9KR68_9GLOM|nr:17411_t:CDS:2 [Cetraspora pellucida]
MTALQKSYILAIALKYPRSSEIINIIDRQEEIFVVMIVHFVNKPRLIMISPART